MWAMRCIRLFLGARLQLPCPTEQEPAYFCSKGYLSSEDCIEVSGLEAYRLSRAGVEDVKDEDLPANLQVLIFLFQVASFLKQLVISNSESLNSWCANSAIKPRILKDCGENHTINVNFDEGVV
jgi:hypothetical protein